MLTNLLYMRRLTAHFHVTERNREELISKINESKVTQAHTETHIHMYVCEKDTHYVHL